MAFIEFNQKRYFGVSEMLLPEPPAPQINREYYWGLSGETEIYGGNAGRPITCVLWMEPPHNGTSGENFRKLQEEITLLEQQIGTFGMLRQTVLLANRQLVSEWPDCRFEAVQRLALPGQSSPQPALAYNRGWVQLVRLRWYQLSASLQPS